MATTTAASAAELFDRWSDPFAETNHYEVAAAVRSLAVGDQVGGQWVPRLTVTGRGDIQTVLTGDGYFVKRTGWCQCQTAPAADSWVYYEAWSAEGRQAHGYCCATCRGITQTG